MLENYRKHVAERAEIGIVPKPLDPSQTAELVELLKIPQQVKNQLFLTSWLTVSQRVLMKQLI